MGDTRILSGLCLLPLLQPNRRCIHPFLTDEDAARLMQTSRSTTAALLFDYAFLHHVFTFRSHSAADVKRSVAFYARYHMRILRMCLPASWNEPLIDSVTGLSHLPASLLAFTLGLVDGSCTDRCESAAHKAFENRGSERGHSAESEQEEKKKAMREIDRWIRPVIGEQVKAVATAEWKG